VFISAYGSIVGGADNRLKLRRVASAIVLLVDGLGYENLTEFKGHARNLYRLLEQSSTAIRCGFPSSTAVSLTSLGTGLKPGAHGIAGYQVLDSEGRIKNMLNGWASEAEAIDWQAQETIASHRDVAVHMVASEEYRGSGFTAAIMRGAEFHSARQMTERAKVAVRLAEQKGALVYLYAADLDQASHRFGVGSPQWLAVLEEIDASLPLLIQGKHGLVVTADHGVINIPAEQHIYLDAVPGFADAVRVAVGDPRALYCYGNREAAAEALAEYEDVLIITDLDELVSKGWLGEMPQIKGKLPDFVLVCRGAVACYDRRTAKPASLQMIGQHGSISDAEMRVPLILAAGYSSS
jgi:hypothetical protein